MFTLRNVPVDETDSPEKLKKLITDQCGEAVAKQMDVGYFNKHSKKMWLNNRLDVNDLWDLVYKEENITLWCTETADNSRKRIQQDINTNETEDSCVEKATKKQKLSKIEERKLEAEKYEQILSEKHGNTYTQFQYKLWAEMYVGKVHPSLEEPPNAAMFRHDSKQSKKSQPDLNNTVVDGMLTVMNTLCQALTPTKQVEKQGPSTPTFSPMKQAQLRSTYLKQLGELRDLHDGGVLLSEEYEEQRSGIVNLLRQLK